jgi:zinc transporter ZupT
MLTTFLYGFVVGAAVASVCARMITWDSGSKLMFDVVTAVFAVVAVVIAALLLIVRDVQAWYWAAFALAVFVAPPVVGFSIGAFIIYCVGRYVRRR